MNNLWRQNAGAHPEFHHKFRLSKDNVRKFLEDINKDRQYFRLAIMGDPHFGKLAHALEIGPDRQNYQNFRTVIEQCVTAFNEHRAGLNTIFFKNRVWYYYDFPYVYVKFPENRKTLPLADKGSALSLRGRPEVRCDIPDHGAYVNHALTLKVPKQSEHHRENHAIEFYLPDYGGGYDVDTLRKDLFASKLPLDFFEQTPLPGRNYVAHNRQIVNFEPAAKNAQNFQFLRNFIDNIYKEFPKGVRDKLPGNHNDYLRYVRPVLDVEIVSIRFDFSARLEHYDATLQISLDIPLSVVDKIQKVNDSWHADEIAKILGDYEVEIRLEFARKKPNPENIGETILYHEKFLEDFDPLNTPYLTEIKEASKYERFVDLVLNHDRKRL